MSEVQLRRGGSIFVLTHQFCRPACTAALIRPAFLRDMTMASCSSGKLHLVNKERNRESQSNAKGRKSKETLSKHTKE